MKLDDRTKAIIDVFTATDEQLAPQNQTRGGCEWCKERNLICNCGLKCMEFKSHIWSHTPSKPKNGSECGCKIMPNGDRLLCKLHDPTSPLPKPEPKGWENEIYDLLTEEPEDLGDGVTATKIHAGVANEIIDIIHKLLEELEEKEHEHEILVNTILDTKNKEIMLTKVIAESNANQRMTYYKGYLIEKIEGMKITKDMEVATVITYNQALDDIFALIRKDE